MKKEIKIVICEDEEFVGRSYERRLKLEGYAVIRARNGKEGLALMRSEKPDLVLLDLMMPVKNGFEVLKEAQKDEELKDIPVVVASNLGQKSDIEEAKRLGAVDFVVKSNLSLQELVKTLQQYLPNTSET